MSRIWGFLSGFIFLSAFALPLQAATYNVDRTDDTAAATACDDGTANDCSLRGAIIAANTNPGADTVNLLAGTYTLTIAGAGEDVSATGDLDITDALDIVGAAAATTIIDGGDLDRVLHVPSPCCGSYAVSLSKVTIQNGNTADLDSGGGIYNNYYSSLSLTDCIVKDNTTGITAANYGGGIFSYGPLTLLRTTVTENSAYYGGGVYVNGYPGASTSTMTDSFVTENMAVYYGGGIYHDGYTLALDNTVVSGNSLSLYYGYGGGIYNGSPLTLVNCTVSDNSGAGYGGGIYGGSTMMLTDSHVTGNTGDYQGGGIYNTGTLTLVTSSVSDNILTGISYGYAYGAGIFTTSSTSLTDSEINDNSATASYVYGAGLYDQYANLALQNSTVSGNSGTSVYGSYGGGMYLYPYYSTSPVTLTNSTVSGNSAITTTGGYYAYGGGIYEEGSGTNGVTNLSNVTLFNNTATNTADGYGTGGGIYHNGVFITKFKNTIIAGNIASTDPDCYGFLSTSLGYNLIQTLSAGCSTSFDLSTITGVDPFLGPLDENGGPTPTHLPSFGSAVIDAGNPSGCTDETGTLLAVDQRGATRPQGAACDIGAVEVVPVPLDHFLCYKAKTTKKTTPFDGATVTLVDQFHEPGPTELKKTIDLCTPVSKNGELVTDDATHLKAYQISKGPKHAKRSNIKVTNQFGELRVDTSKPSRLLVPAAKKLTAPFPPLPGGESAVDHYKCYDIKVTKGTTPFSPLAVTLSDQFEDDTFDVLKPKRLCNPVNKNDEGIKNPAAHLMCYQVKPSGKHPDQLGLYTTDQLGQERLDTVSEEELCVPSAKTLP